MPLTFQEYSAWISTNGVPLPECSATVDITTRTVSFWIPGYPAQTFVVHWVDHGSKIDSCAFITLDGQVFPGRFLNGKGATCRWGARTSATTERPFFFQKVKNADEYDASLLPSEVGTIRLRIKHIRRVGTRPSDQIHTPPKPLLGPSRVGDLRVELGADIPTREQHETTWEVRSHDLKSPNPSTYMTFIFRVSSCAGWRGRMPPCCVREIINAHLFQDDKRKVHPAASLVKQVNGLSKDTVAAVHRRSASPGAAKDNGTDVKLEITD